MIFDTHIHIDNFVTPEPDRLLREMDENRVDKMALLSEEPAYFEKDPAKRKTHNKERLHRLMEWCASSGGRLVPIYFICPIEEDAAEQADRAVEAGAAGFKVICETHYPGDERAMPVYQHIADLGKSILFHSGILWDYGDNGNYNRPCNWECMFEIKNIKFALAHISWPWCDECIALYGKFSAMFEHPKYGNQKMYIDMTPGTPPCYRKNVIKTLHDVGYYAMNDRLMFGTDSFTNGFLGKDVWEMNRSDRGLLSEAGFDAETCEKISSKNALEFWGIKE